MTGKKGFLTDMRYFNKGGIFTITLSYEQFNESTDKLIQLNNQKKYWICDYKNINDSFVESESTLINTNIYGDNSLRYGRFKTWSVVFKDSIGNELAIKDFIWNIKSDFEIISKEIETNKIQLKCTNEKAIDSSFVLEILDNDGKILSGITITVTG